jgi:hypothetical protein
MAYCVYRVSFRTQRGTARTYIGYTGCADVRRAYHNSNPPAWLKCKQRESELKFDVLEDNIPSREAALAVEALFAARAIAAEPDTARGGPWAKPTLTSDMFLEIQAVSKLRGLISLQSVAHSEPHGRLYRHLRDLRFEDPSDVAAKLVCRGAHVVKGRSGTRGNENRKQQLREGKLTRGTPYWRRVKRGRDPNERRAEENRRRPSRAMKAMKA